MRDLWSAGVEFSMAARGGGGDAVMWVVAQTEGTARRVVSRWR